MLMLRIATSPPNVLSAGTQREPWREPDASRPTHCAAAAAHSSAVPVASTSRPGRNCGVLNIKEDRPGKVTHVPWAECQHAVGPKVKQ
jgi:hypothetical protein